LVVRPVKKVSGGEAQGLDASSHIMPRPFFGRLHRHEIFKRAEKEGFFKELYK
jgi:hypothetical protein